MTLKELLDSVSRLKNWKVLSENGTPGFDIPQARFRGTPTAETSASAVECIARQADPYEELMYKTDVH
jgi:hypothetical protein